MPFTDKQISSLKPKATRYEKREPGRSGLTIRVSPSGVKAWAFRYRFDGTHRRMVFPDPYPKMGVAAAREALAAARRKLEQGIDPGAQAQEARERERNAETVEDMVDEYIARHAKPNMKAATAAEDNRILRREVLPSIGKLKAKDVTRRDLIKVLDTIEDRGAPVLRNRTAGVLSRMFAFGMDRGIVDASPAVSIRRLDEKARERFLTMQEIHSFWHGLDNIDAIPQVRLALRFLLVTGQRRGEVAGAPRAEIDGDLWTLPAERAKNGRENIVPLPALALALVEEADRHRVRPEPTRKNRKDRPAYDDTPSPFLFPARIVGRQLEPAALTRAVNRNRDKLGIGDATVHDLRRTFSTWQGEIGIPDDVVSKLLNHAPTGITRQVYNLSVVLEPRRRAMERWCDWLALVIDGKFDAAKQMEGAEVVPLAATA